jgi:hypothetical protein
MLSINDNDYCFKTDNAEEVALEVQAQTRTRSTERDEGDDKEEEDEAGDEKEDSDWEIVNVDADILYSSSCELVTAAAVCAVQPFCSSQACIGCVQKELSSLHLR